MILYGAGGHAKVVKDSLHAVGENAVAVIDNDSSIFSFGSAEVFHEYSEKVFPDEKLIIAVGDNLIRKRLAELVKHQFGTVVHPSAVVSPESSFGVGSVLLPNCVINSDTEIGKHVIINSGAVVEHDCYLQNYVHVSPNATLSGMVKVGEGTQIGAGAVVLPGISIGKWCIIGAGAVVAKNVEDFSIMAGVPAKLLKKTIREI